MRIIPLTLKSQVEGESYTPSYGLFNRREPKNQAFPAIEFLRRAYRKNARRIKLKQWFLIILRSLLLAVLALSLARPIWDPNDSHSSEVDTLAVDGAQVIVLDLHYSMNFKVDESTLLARAKAHAIQLATESKGPVALVLVRREPEAPIG